MATTSPGPATKLSPAQVRPFDSSLVARAPQAVGLAELAYGVAFVLLTALGYASGF